MEATIAGMWKFNKAVTTSRFWEGTTGITHIEGRLGRQPGDASEGEFTCFLPLDKERDDAFAATVRMNYSFEEFRSTSMAGILYNSAGSTSASVTNLFNFRTLCPQPLPLPACYFLPQFSYPFTPLLNGGVAFILQPGRYTCLFANPTLTLSVAENWDLDFVGQITFLIKEKRGILVRYRLSF